MEERGRSPDRVVRKDPERDRGRQIRGMTAHPVCSMQDQVCMLALVPRTQPMRGGGHR